MRNVLQCAGLMLFILAMTNCKARAQLTASATISAQQVGTDSYLYSLALTNDSSSTVTAGAFWFAWVPGFDFLLSHPTSISSPDGWTGVDQPDAYGVASVLWGTSSDPISPGQTLTGFSFTTPDDPETILDGLYTNQNIDLPITTSFVYVNPPDKGFYDEIVPTVVASPVPEPASSITLLAVAPLILRRRRATTA